MKKKRRSLSSKKKRYRNRKIDAGDGGRTDAEKRDGQPSGRVQMLRKRAVVGRRRQSKLGRSTARYGTGSWPKRTIRSRGKRVAAGAKAYRREGQH